MKKIFLQSHETGKYYYTSIEEMENTHVYKYISYLDEIEMSYDNFTDLIGIGGYLEPSDEEPVKNETTTRKTAYIENNTVGNEIKRLIKGRILRPVDPVEYYCEERIYNEAEFDDADQFFCWCEKNEIDFTSALIYFQERDFDVPAPEEDDEF